MFTYDLGGKVERAIPLSIYHARLCRNVSDQHFPGRLKTLRRSLHAFRYVQPTPDVSMFTVGTDRAKPLLRNHSRTRIIKTLRYVY